MSECCDCNKQIANSRIIRDLTKNGLKLKHLSDEEISKLPSDFLKDYIKKSVKAWELLELWHRLPVECTIDYHIQILLPCFIHYNRPGGTHFDGPPPSQKHCTICKTITRIFGVENIHDD